MKRVRNQIQKGADPERAARCGYKNACDYFELMNKRILIQQRALACLSKSVAHILQRELCTMGNTGLLRREAEMTLLQPHLGDSRRQELKNLPFWPTHLFKSQLVKDGEDFLFKKSTPKDSQGFGPHQNKPFRGPHHNKKRGSYRKRPYGGNSSQSSNQSFSSGGGNRISEAPGVVFDPTQVDEGMETPPHNDSFQASLSPPVGGRVRSFRKDWLTNKCSNNVLNIITNGYVLPFMLKPNLVRAPLIQSGYKALQKELALTSCIQSLLSKNAIERVENVKSLGFYSCLFLVPKPHQRWRPVIDLSRPNTFLLERLSRCLSSHPHPPKLTEIPKVLPQVQVIQFTSLPFGLATAPQVFTMFVKEVKLMTLSRGIRLHQYLDNWLIRAQSHEEAQVNTQTVVDLTQSLGWIINQKSKLKPTPVFSFMGYEYHLD